MAKSLKKEFSFKNKERIPLNLSTSHKWYQLRTSGYIQKIILVNLNVVLNENLNTFLEKVSVYAKGVPSP